ncbi:hypothetical protein GCK72_021300 [Caenorhabditis remanei]|uniref:SCP domain-containing protein n=1 Tax=Caenorhabditis remanei TaxID=31234 RepID=A0A6A5GJE7_CAERE|nr:hypothetical protein GCK72_021300 [Caenorhabditis remanei]KAF1754736.1 hypothetical protein GCK72_021300 [Caenorhabditis remanei]
MIIRNIHWIIMITSLISIVKPDEKPVNKKLILTRYNGYRRYVARRMNISNMWKLEWDKYLVERAIEMTSEHDRTNINSEDFLKLKQGSDYRFFFTHFNNASKKREEDYTFDNFYYPGLDDTNFQNEWKGARQLVDCYKESVYPIQKKIGCIWYMIGTAKDVAQYRTYDTFCLLGPYGFDETRASIEYGPPGSNCTDGHGEDGLCIPGPGLQTPAPFKWDGDDEEEGGKKKKKKKKDDDEEEYDLVLILTNGAGGSGISVVGLLIIVFVGLH